MLVPLLDHAEGEDQSPAGCVEAEQPVLVRLELENTVRALHGLEHLGTKEATRLRVREHVESSEQPLLVPKPLSVLLRELREKRPPWHRAVRQDEEFDPEVLALRAWSRPRNSHETLI